MLPSAPPAFSGLSQSLSVPFELTLSGSVGVDERGGHAHISELKAPETEFGTFQKLFQDLYDHEIFVSQSINELVHVALEEKDYATHNFLQWYVAEQIEEEALARTILDKINLIGNDKGGLYLFDRDVQQITVESAASDPAE